MNDMTRRLLIGLGALVGVALIVAVAISAASPQATDTSSEFGSPTVEGEILPLFDPAADDPTVGQPAPVVTSTDMDGETVRVVGPSDSAKILIFLAHWCPHCQNEVKMLTNWAKSNELPEGVEIYGVLSLSNRARTNWPPTEWLAREGWPWPVLMDDEAGTVATHFGLAGTPFWVVLNPDNTVAGRASGELPVEIFEQVVADAASRVSGSVGTSAPSSPDTTAAD